MLGPSHKGTTELNRATAIATCKSEWIVSLADRILRGVGIGDGWRREEESELISYLKP